MIIFGRLDRRSDSGISIHSLSKRTTLPLPLLELAVAVMFITDAGVAVRVIVDDMEELKSPCGSMGVLREEPEVRLLWCDQSHGLPIDAISFRAASLLLQFFLFSQITDA